MVGTNVLGLFLCIVIYYLAEINIFSFLSDIKLPIWEVIFIISILLFINQIKNFSPMLIDPIILGGILWLHGYRKFTLKLLLFILAPGAYVDLASRFLATSIIPYFFSIGKVTFSNIWVNLGSYGLVLFGLKLLGYLIGKEYKLFIKDDQSFYAKQLYYIFTAFIIAYYLDIFVVMGFTDPFLSYQKEILVPKSYKIVFFSFMLLFIFLVSYFNHKSINYLENKITEEQAAYITNLENYAQSLEILYRNVKVFQRDYLKQIDQIGESIVNRDLNEVKMVYNNSIQNASKFWDKNHYSISKLSNISISSVKSLLSAKIIAAEDLGIKVTLEVPDTIHEIAMLTFDLILLISIFCDNAIEEAIKSDEKRIEIACFTHEREVIFVVANSTIEERVNIKPIFREGYSSKGLGRGLGLAKVNHVLEKYQNVTLHTESASFRFSQTLIISE